MHMHEQNINFKNILSCAGCRGSERPGRMTHQESWCQTATAPMWEAILKWSAQYWEDIHVFMQQAQHWIVQRKEAVISEAKTWLHHSDDNVDTGDRKTRRLTCAEGYLAEKDWKTFPIWSKYNTEHAYSRKAHTIQAWERKVTIKHHTAHGAGLLDTCVSLHSLTHSLSRGCFPLCNKMLLFLF